VTSTSCVHNLEFRAWTLRIDITTDKAEETKLAHPLIHRNAHADSLTWVAREVVDIALDFAH
jgi:hypothetical protein